MGGTSMDGVDVVLVDVCTEATQVRWEVLAAKTWEYPESLRSQILQVAHGEPIPVPELAALDDQIAQIFAQAAREIQVGFSGATIIGSHGQTVYHRPPHRENTRRMSTSVQSLSERGQSGNGSPSSLATPGVSGLGYSLQLGRGATIAEIAGIPTVSNFRAADIHAGGHGAPLVPRVDAYLLGDEQQTRCIQNIGGIGNVTYLPARGALSVQETDTVGHWPVAEFSISSAQRAWESQIMGWDTGPGNSLLDLAAAELSGGEKKFDQNGEWAAQGKPDENLVARWLQHPFFQEPPPKSTGRELFGRRFWQACLADARSRGLTNADILATLTELTAASIAGSYKTFLPQMPDVVLLCGGGSHNSYLQQRLQRQLQLANPSAAPIELLVTNEVGVPADFKEAIAFAILACWRQQGIPGNLPSVTGAQDYVLLGDRHGFPKSTS